MAPHLRFLLFILLFGHVEVSCILVISALLLKDSIKHGALEKKFRPTEGKAASPSHLGNVHQADAAQGDRVEDALQVQGRQWRAATPSPREDRKSDGWVAKMGFLLALSLLMPCWLESQELTC